MNMELMKDGYPPIIIKVENRAKYYEAIRDYETTASPDKMMELIDGYLEEELERYLTKLKA